MLKYVSGWLAVVISMLCLAWTVPQARAASTVVRTVTNNSTPSPDVSLLATPAATVSVYAVEETLPAGLTPSGMNESGTWDAGNRKVKWGPFFDHTVRTLTYEVTGLTARTRSAGWAASTAQA